jgi:hypothetical protein
MAQKKAPVDVLFLISARIDSGADRGAPQLTKDVRVLKKAADEIERLRAIVNAPRGTDGQILKERELTAAAISGAIAFGVQGVNPPPSDDHWLASFWRLGRDMTARAYGLPAVASGEASSPTSSPTSPPTSPPTTGAMSAPQLWIVEYGAIDLPIGHPARLTCFEGHESAESAQAAIDAMEFNARMFAVPVPPDGVGLPQKDKQEQPG